LSINCSTPLVLRQPSLLACSPLRNLHRRDSPLRPTSALTRCRFAAARFPQSSPYVIVASTLCPLRYSFSSVLPALFVSRPFRGFASLHAPTSRCGVAGFLHSYLFQYLFHSDFVYESNFA
ncbi:hypothetical protein U1Q18_050251, partial [Sarracenia purpurea var. burkii]